MKIPKLKRLPYGIRCVRNNPLHLTLVSQYELEWRLETRMSKGDLVKLVMPDELANCFDYALPQNWLDQFDSEDYHTMLCQCVWIYPPKPSEYCLLGVALNLFTGDLFL